MRPPFASLKYVPAVLCGVLVVAWLVNFIGWFGIFMDLHDRELHATANAGSLVLVNIKFKPQPPSLRFVFRWREQKLSYEPLGKLQVVIGDESNLGVGSMYLLFPIPLAVTLLSFVAIAPFIHYRFPLWSYFVWTALVAAELAFYLRA